MNTLRRISRPLVKSFAVGAVLVAAALPAMAIAGPASAATNTLVCTSASAGSPSCSSGYAIIGQGFSGNFYANSGGTFANDQGLGGQVTITTTAPGVTFTGVTETSSSDVTATISSTSATTPGFYPVTVTDDNGTDTLAIGLGVDVGPQIATITGNSGTTGGSSTISITGSNLQGISASLEVPDGCTDSNSPTVTADTNTSATVTISNSGASACTYTLVLTSPYPFDDAPGSTVAAFVVSGSSLSITGINPSELSITGLSAGSPTSTSTVTLTGTGFEPGAVATLSDTTDISGTLTYVNSTTLSGSITLTYGVVANQENVTVTNPDTTSVVGTGILGIGEAPVPVASAPVAPTIGCNGGPLSAGLLTVFTCSGSSTFPISSSTTFGLSVSGNTTASEMFSGKVLSVTNNVATILANPPTFSTTATTAALTGGTSITVPVASTVGMPTAPFNAWISDGASTEAVLVESYTTSSVTLHAAVANNHAAGVDLEWNFDTGVNYTVTATDPTVSATSLIAVDAPQSPTYNGGSTAGSFLPGTYTIGANVPGFGFTTGASIYFLGSTGATGTVTSPNGDSATLNVTVPATISEPGVTITAAAAAGQDQATLSDTTYVKAGASLTVGPNPTDATKTTQTLVVASVGGGGVVTFTTNFAQTYNSGDPVTGIQEPQPSGALDAVLTNGAGEAIFVTPLLGVASIGTAALVSSTLSTNTLGDGAGLAGGPPWEFEAGAPFTGGVRAVFTTTGSPLVAGTTNNPWTITSTTPGVTFHGALVLSTTEIRAYATVASNVAASTTVPVTISNGELTYQGTITVNADAPTVTGITSVGTLGPSNTSETVGLVGTGFNASPVGNNFCYTTSPGVTCAVQNTVTDSTTSMTVVLTTQSYFPDAPASYEAQPFPLNGSYGIVVGQFSDGASGELATAVNVAGEPTATAVSPTTVNAGHVVGSVTVTGTGFNTVTAPSGPFECWSLYLAAGSTTPSFNGYCTVTVNSGTQVTINDPNSHDVGTIYYEFGDGESTWQIDTPTIAVISAPEPSFFEMRNDSSIPTSVAAGSSNAPFKLVGLGGAAFLPGDTVSIPAADGTVTTTLVTPNAIFGTVTIAQSVTPGPITATVTNTNGTSATVSMTIVAGPAISTINGTATTAVLDGNATKLVIVGSHFVAGATVATTNAALATFGTVAVTDSTEPLNTCTTWADDCDTITVTISPLSFSGAVPIVTGLVVTNPVGDGSTTVQSDVAINPVPAVTGVYYVPTFTTNAEVTITGTGFETGITASSSNPDYTVLAVSSTPTTVTLLVTTDSNATSGTSSTITLTNPDGGSTTFPLNGGPNPKTLTPTPKATAVHGLVHTGKTSTVTISGSHFYGSPHITSNAKGTRVQVSHDTGKLLTVKVTTKSTTPKGRHTFIIVFANGEQTSVKYTQVK